MANEARVSSYHRSVVSCLITVGGPQLFLGTHHPGSARAMYRYSPLESSEMMVLFFLSYHFYITYVLSSAATSSDAKMLCSGYSSPAVSWCFCTPIFLDDPFPPPGKTSHCKLYIVLGFAEIGVVIFVVHTSYALLFSSSQLLFNRLHARRM